MTRLIVHVEGQTEETFVNELLGPHLYSRGFKSISARLLGNARQREHRGGIRPWPLVRSDIVRHLKEDPGCYSTTMVDFYALPSTGAGAWPGRAAAAGFPFLQKARHIEDELLKDLLRDQSSRFDPRRFIPFVTMYEFEGLLFSDCAAFCKGIDRTELLHDFQKIRSQFNTPEEINDSPLTAPSKRVERLVPGYSKPMLGALAAIEIGLLRIREECPHFSAWLSRLESLCVLGH